MSAKKRIERLEKEHADENAKRRKSRIDPKDRLIMIQYYEEGNEAEEERLLEERMAEMREKYGPAIRKDDFQIIMFQIVYEMSTIKNSLL